MSARLSVTRAAELAGGVRASYVRYEISVGRLRAVKNATGGWEIEQADFDAWMANPRRGSRRKGK